MLITLFRRILFTGLLIIWLSVFSNAQVSVEPAGDTIPAHLEELVRKTLIGNGVLTGHIKVKGSPQSFGRFTLNSKQNLVKEGLVLSTGHLLDINGPNDTTSTTTIMQTKGDVDLGKHTGNRNGDAVSIEFDFIPTTDTIAFYYFFASEEYPEYVGKGFNDAFAFLIKGPNYPMKTNIARVTLGARYIPITIDNVNYINNSEYFISNHLKEDIKKIPRKLRSKLGEPQLLNEIEFDGMTTRLRAVAKVIPFEIYTLKIVIADVGDLRYDSGVFLEKESFYSPPSAQIIDTAALIQKFAMAYANNTDKLAGLAQQYPRHTKVPEQRLDTLRLVFNYQTDSFKISESEQSLLQTAIMDAKSTFGSFQILVRGHTDSIGAYKHNVVLSKNRAFYVSNYLLEQYSIKPVASYAAFSEPVASNKSENGRKQNRRVEILFIRD